MVGVTQGEITSLFPVRPTNPCYTTSHHHTTLHHTHCLGLPRIPLFFVLWLVCVKMEKA